MFLPVWDESSSALLIISDRLMIYLRRNAIASMHQVITVALCVYPACSYTGMRCIKNVEV